MVCGEAEDAGRLSPAKDDNEAARHFTCPPNFADSQLRRL